MKIKKQKIEELIDADGNLIGSDAFPTTGSDRETDANNTTDYNARVHGQNFKNDFLGRFGFYFYEDEEREKPEVVEDLAKLMYDKFVDILKYYNENPEELNKDYQLHAHGAFDTQPKEKKDVDYKWAWKVMTTIKPHLEKVLDDMQIGEGVMNESKVVEDRLVDKKKDKGITKKKEDTELKSKKIEKVAGLLNKLNKDDLNKLVNLLELKKK
jgi:hypothetical protein